MEPARRIKFNIICLGGVGAGKTCVLNCKRLQPFDYNTLQTIVIEEELDKEIFDGRSYNFKIFDTPGQERYKSVLSPRINISDGFLLFFQYLIKIVFI